MKKNGKNYLKTVLIASAFCIGTIMPAFAAETQEEYRTEAAVIQSEIGSIEDQISTLISEIKDISAKYRELSKEYKETKTSSIGKDALEEAKALRRSLRDSNSFKDDGISLKELHTEIKTAREAGDYNKALEILGNIRDKKSAWLESLKEIYPNWQQLGTLIGK